MVSKTLVSSTVTLVIVSQLARIYGLPNKNESSYLYVIGGELDYLVFSNSNSRLSTATGEWKTMKSMPTARNRFCGAVVDKKIYLFGGHKSRDEAYTVEMASIGDVYDCLTDTYTPLPSMPDHQAEGCSAAVLGQSIYYSGGLVPDPPPNRGLFYGQKNLFRLDTQTNRWTTLSPMNQARSYYQLVELDGLLYAIGGDRDNSMEIYNTTTNKWTTSLAKSHYDLWQFKSATSHEGKIYHLASKGFQVYSPVIDQWSNLTGPWQFDEDNFTWSQLVSMNGKVWAVGGKVWFQFDAKHPKLPKLMENLRSYDPSTDQWTNEQKIDVRRESGFLPFVVNL